MAEMRQPRYFASRAPTSLGPASRIKMRTPPTTRISRYGKVAIDVTVASIAIVLLLPLLLIVAIAVALDGGPVVFAHERVGLNGRSFQCLKFRSMATDADKVLRDLLATDAASAAEWVATQKLRADPRVTKVGRLLRATSLDELPQLINVLRRDMSLVGPRPITEKEQARYGKYIEYYYLVRPGITGLWQVSGRSNTTFPRRVALDRAYVREWTLRLDLFILAKTIPAVLRRSGAH